ncbi:MAG: YybH family protein [Pyrinomonadaceae bacterium]
MKRTVRAGIISLLFALAISAQTVSKELSDLANAERAFAAETVKIGFRDGFIKYFADDGIGFAPHPQRTREELQKSPAPAGPRKVIFNWAPMFGDISSAGDLGYTTGPVLYTDIGANPRPPRHGMYFSVWQKQADGSWKVVVDMGVGVPEAVASIDTPFAAASKKDSIRLMNAGKSSGPDFLEVDAALTSSIEKNGMAAAYDAFLDPEFRVHRNGQMPITTKDALHAYFSKQTNSFLYKTIGGKISASKDVAFTYGSFRLGESQEIAGYYVHVWRKDSNSRWRLVADVLNELPKK